MSQKSTDTETSSTANTLHITLIVSGDQTSLQEAYLAFHEWILERTKDKDLKVRSVKTDLHWG